MGRFLFRYQVKNSFLGFSKEVWQKLQQAEGVMVLQQLKDSLPSYIDSHSILDPFATEDSRIWMLQLGSPEVNFRLIVFVYSL